VVRNTGVVLVNWRREVVCERIQQLVVLVVFPEDGRKIHRMVKLVTFFIERHVRFRRVVRMNANTSVD